jgi:CBS domain-containing protein
MTIYAKDIMTRYLITAKPEMMCEEAMDRMFTNRVSGMPVLDEHGLLIGVISMFDILDANLNSPYNPGYFEDTFIDRLLDQGGFHLEYITKGYVSEFMNRHVYTASPETSLEEIAQQMVEHRIHRVIILKPNEQIPVGIVTTFDVMKLLAQGVLNTSELEYSVR